MNDIAPLQGAFHGGAIFPGFSPWAITFFAFSEGSDPIRKLKEIKNTRLFTWIYRMDRIRESYRSDRLENHETRKYSHGYTGWTGFKIV